MTKKIFMALAAALLCLGCTKEVLSPTGKQLGSYNVESDAGSVTVLVTAEGIWRAVSLEEWISVDSQWHRDVSSIVISYGSNQSVEGLHRTSREGKVLIESYDGAERDTLVIHQKGLQL